MGREERLSDVWSDIDDDVAFAPLRGMGVNLIAGSGSLRPLAMIVLDFPDATSNARNRAASGPDGDILRQLMELADLRMAPGPKPANAYVTYCIKFRPSRRWSLGAGSLEGHPDHAALGYLRREFAILKPHLLIPVGANAIQLLDSRWPIMKASDLAAHGPTTLKDDRTWICPMMSPLAGRKKPSLQGFIERQWEYLWPELIQRGYAGPTPDEYDELLRGRESY